MSNTVLKVEGLYKKFCKSLKRSMLYGTFDVVRDMANISYDGTTLRKKEFWALQDINFELKRGETLGLIGQNGCGKTTLLRLINGIFPPDKGKMTINGRIGALIAVGAGFHPHMTGRENIFLNGTILGMTKSEIKRKLDEIIDFAEIGEFIDSPVASYSSGMTVRLGYSIASRVNPQILLIDEILAVGDISFRLKCFNNLRQLINNGTSLILVSHSSNDIVNTCNNTIWMKDNKIYDYGDSNIITQKYESWLINNQLKSSENHIINKQLGIEIIRTVVNGKDSIINNLDGNEIITFRITIYYSKKIENLFLFFALRNTANVMYYGKRIGLNVNKFVNGENTLEVSIPANYLLPGIHILNLALSADELVGNYIQYVPNAIMINIIGRNETKISGVINVPLEVKYEELVKEN